MECQRNTIEAWECYIEAVEGNFITARLCDPTCLRPTEQARIPMNAIPRADRALIRKGAFFEMIIHRHETPSCETRGVMRIKFLRSVWEYDKEELRNEARTMSEALNKEDGEAGK